MSFFPVELQILSHLHLETPLLSPSYTTFKLDGKATNLCLLGDIGLVNDNGLFVFLRATLNRLRGHRIFYIIGNHEAYKMQYAMAVQKLRDFEEEARANYGSRFILLDRNRFDLDDSTTLLGCTLWSAVSVEQASEALVRLTDLNEQRGIRSWSLEDHLVHHNQDLDWLNAQVHELQEKEPHRQVAILTHHSPTMDPRATNPRHRGSPLSTCFATDLSAELCWKSPMVKLWAFGHTHYNCAYRDEGTAKLVLANQRGYQNLDKIHGTPKLKTTLVEVNPAEWEIIKLPNQKPDAKTQDQDTKLKPPTQIENANNKKRSDKTVLSLLQRASDRLQAFGRVRTGSSE